jgi:hypothetical protein
MGEADRLSLIRWKGAVFMPKYVILENGFMDLEERAKLKGKPVVAEWEDGKGRILSSSKLPEPWVDDEWREMPREDWRTLCCLKTSRVGKLEARKGQPMDKAEFEKEQEDCLARIQQTE